MGILSFLFAGLGQIILGQVAKGFVMFFAAIIVGATTGEHRVIPVLVFAVFAGADAYWLARRLKDGHPIDQWEFGSYWSYHRQG